MPIFNYKATNMSGKTIHGTMESASKETLKNALKEQKLYLFESREIQKKSNRKSLKADELSEFSRQIGSMLDAGVSLVQAMAILLERQLSKRLKDVFSDLNIQIRQGIPLSVAMEKQGNAFPELMINMYKAGEESGTLDKTATRMAEHYDKEYKLNQDIKGATTYPIILLCLTVGILVLIFTVILPQFMTLFEDMELPMSTQIVIGISDILTQHFVIIICIVIIAVLGIRMLLKQPHIAIAVDKIKLKLPKIGYLLSIIYTARFARTLSSLYSSGMSISDSLAVSQGTIGNKYISSQFGDLIRRVRSGIRLSDALAQVDGFDTKLASTVLVGEETGKLDSLLVSVADSFEYESNAAVKSLVTFIEPVMIVIMAALIGFVMISVMQPIYALYGNVSNSY